MGGDSVGRFCNALVVRIQQIPDVFEILYAPNSFDHTFFDNVKLILLYLTDSALIIAEDFNAVGNPSMDYSNPLVLCSCSRSPKYIKS